MEHKVTSKDITRALFWKYASKQRHVINNCHLLEFESDFLYVTNAGYMHEIEIKISRGDYKADFKKKHNAYNNITRLTSEVEKHKIIPQGLYGVKHFSFAVPEGLIKPEEVPEYAGLCYVTKTNTGFVNLKWIKKPPKLPHARRILKSEVSRLNTSIKYRWLDFWLKT